VARAAWFKKVRKFTFTSEHIRVAAAHVGRTYSKGEARSYIAGSAVTGDFVRLDRGLYALTDQGLAHVKRLRIGPTESVLRRQEKTATTTPPAQDTTSRT
jgi:DNA-binding PadR family transcriptional regulator